MILVVGANGMLGRDLMRVFQGEARGLDIDEIDITSPESVRRVILTVKPRVIINAAAYTDVDGCESERDRAVEVNGEGVAYLSMAAGEAGAKLVQVSTDYVFDGGKGTPYIEEDIPRPISVYGESKLAGELNAQLAPEWLVVRTQWLYGVHGKNFVETMLRIASEKKEVSVVDDQIGSPTWTKDLARAIGALVAKGCHGIYHATNSGTCSWNEFARAIFEEAGVPMTVNSMSTKELNRPAPRPLFSVLDNGKLIRDTGFEPQPWRDALRCYLQERKDLWAHL
ncbi:dTDP-4-dehydrorhamnose reductase [Geobacter sp. DSM 9736]|uniref:dTDP-4-dehydrorhamnose reductase n=1 Tax=Geobacter sp. DSM 9736 TaxID=1277350 RepID=UPI000B514703|nr:dTDP-4-dehydrorhamnose reductase [Geobacter sp. DSM 9736]SNB44663.1 dTDP-4-dehydrorhamnose reductase [Geobacter sp. DSM 9736]